jgi:SAM-dependent methyltransferase
MKHDLQTFSDFYQRGTKPWDSGHVCPELLGALNAGKFPGKTVLELGCGTGTNALEFARRGYTVIAVDFVPQAVEMAREKARADITPLSGSVDFRVADVLKDALGGPYDVIFDRGVYHSLRHLNIKRFQEVLEKITRKGTRWLTLAGNAKETLEGPNPPRVSEKEFRAELGGLFEFIDIHEFLLETDKPDFRPLAWAILMERK